MADTDTETPAPVSAETEDRIVDRVVDRLKDILKGGGEAPAEVDEPASMAAEVRREVERLRGEEQARQKEADRDAEVGQIREKVAAIPEKQPREYRKSTQFMRWATEDDK